MSATLYCSFCGKSQHEMRKLLAGLSAYICDDCIKTAFKALEGEGLEMGRVVEPVGFSLPADFPPELLDRMRVEIEVALQNGSSSEEFKEKLSPIMANAADLSSASPIDASSTKRIDGASAILSLLQERYGEDEIMAADALVTALVSLVGIPRARFLFGLN